MSTPTSLMPSSSSPLSSSPTFLPPISSLSPSPSSPTTLTPARPSTPPRTSASTSLATDGTPISLGRSTTDRYLTTDEDESRVALFQGLGGEIRNFVVGPIPPNIFLESFLPQGSDKTLVTRLAKTRLEKFQKEMRKVLVRFTKELELYTPFIDVLSNHLTKLKLVNTSNSTDNNCPRLRPDISVYDKDEGSPDSGLNFSRMSSFIEMKSVDPFDSITPPNESASSISSTADLGQLTAYATAILSTQFRTHTFSVIIIEDRARLIRWDRGGVIVTDSIPYLKASHLFDFFILYNNANREVRGHDPTVNPANNREIDSAREVEGLEKAKSLLTVTVPDNDLVDSVLRRFVISSPELQLGVPVGRWTRVSVALDVSTGRRVLLKDSWRIVHKDIEQEGVLYRVLHEKGVPNIPSRVCDGDIGTEHRHLSQTKNFIEHIPELSAKIQSQFTTYRHYRIVLGTVGRKLETFKTTRELVSAIRAALEAHEGAFGASILHRDISVGNIMIAEDSTEPDQKHIQGGILIDWDLSEFKSKGTSSAPRRAGTWQFMAGDLVMDSTTRHILAHDLESFFWVLMWMVMKHVDTDFTKGPRSSFLNNTLSPKVFGDSGAESTGTTGGEGKLDYLTTKRDAQSIPNHAALSELIFSWRDTLAMRHVDKKTTVVIKEPASQGSPTIVFTTKETTAPDGSTNRSTLRHETTLATDPYVIYGAPPFTDTHDCMLRQIKFVLDKRNWPPGDGARPLSISPAVDTLRVSSKRSRSVVEEEVFDPAPASKRLAGSD